MDCGSSLGRWLRPELTLCVGCIRERNSRQATDKRDFREQRPERLAALAAARIAAKSAKREAKAQRIAAQAAERVASKASDRELPDPALAEQRRLRRNELNRKRYHAAPQSRKLYMRAVKVGLTPAELAEIEDRQQGRCAICEARETPFHMHIDHCHKTGKVRSLLCRRCNMMLGCARDSTDVLERAIAYLKHHEP